MKNTLSTKDRILEYFENQPSDEEGWTPYELSGLYSHIPDKGKANIQVQVNELVRTGKLEARKEGRFNTHVRLNRERPVEGIRNGSKSQTERMLHYLFGLANDKGEIGDEAADARDLQKALGLRDFHDVNKALHNLNKLGILAYREVKVGGGPDHKFMKLRLRTERKDSWPIDMLTDEELPGRTAPDEVTEVINLGEEEMMTLAEEMAPTPLPVETQDLIDSEPDQVDHWHDREDEKIEEIVSPPSEEEVFDPERYPAVAKAVRRYHARKQALGLLRKSGDEDIADLLAEKQDDPMIAELARFLATVGFYG
jgi:hypothetical protein